MRRFPSKQLLVNVYRLEPVALDLSTQRKLNDHLLFIESDRVSRWMRTLYFPQFSLIDVWFRRNPYSC